ncbi:MAG: 2-oxo acid dehydrogenase subunit E2 [Verrucomicrobiota bacterium]|nr:2-oxo acid dehydrogenase subunit E2 [Verrucomicrobiota bacterium]
MNERFVITAWPSAQPQPVVRDGKIVVRQMMKLTLLCDHRIVDGALMRSSSTPSNKNLRTWSFGKGRRPDLIAEKTERPGLKNHGLLLCLKKQMRQPHERRRHQSSRQKSRSTPDDLSTA